MRFFIYAYTMVGWGMLIIMAGFLFVILMGAAISSRLALTGLTAITFGLTTPNVHVDASFWFGILVIWVMFYGILLCAERLTDWIDKEGK